MNFFCAIFSFWDMVDFVLNSGLGTCEKNVWDFCEPDSDANQWGWALNPKGTRAWGRSLPYIIFFLLNPSKSWMHYEGKIQNQPYLKNWTSHKKKSMNSEIRFRTLCIFFIAKCIHFFDFVTIISQKIKNWFFIRFRTLRGIFDQKNENGSFWGGGGCISLTRK